MEKGDKLYCKKTHESKDTIFNLKGKAYEILNIVDISGAQIPNRQVFFIITSEYFLMESFGLERNRILLEHCDLFKYFMTTQESRKLKLKQLNRL